MKEKEDNGINTSNSNYVTNTGNCTKRRKIMEILLLTLILGVVGWIKFDIRDINKDIKTIHSNHLYHIEKDMAVIKEKLKDK